MKFNFRLMVASVILPTMFLGQARADAFSDAAKKLIADSAEKLAQTLHNPAQCPRIMEGYYNADNTASKDVKYIEVYDNKEMQRLELNLNGVEFLPVNGQDTPQKNGYRLTAACVDNAIRIVGKDPSNQLSYTVIKPADDGGLQVEQDSPKVAPLHYSAAGGLRSSMDQIKQWFTPKTKGTGLPQQQ